MEKNLKYACTNNEQNNKPAPATAILQESNGVSLHTNGRHLMTFDGAELVYTSEGMKIMLNGECISSLPFGANGGDWEVRVIGIELVPIG